MRWITRDKHFYKTIVTLAVPISMQALVTFLVGFADNVMISSFGDAAVSGVLFGGQIQFLLQQLVFGLGSALMIMTAQYWGRGDLEPIRRLLGLVLRIGGAAALVMTALSFLMPRQLLGLFTDQAVSLDQGVAYLRILCWSFLFYVVSQILAFAMRSVETAFIGAVASVAALVVNVLLNWVLIFGVGPCPALGVRGAALATLIARGVECAVMVFYVFGKDQKLQMRLRDIFRSSGELLKQYLHYGIPVVAGDLVWAVNVLCQNALLGHYTEDVSAAASITNTLNSLIYVVLNGLWGGVSVLIGKTIGEGRREKVKEYARTCQILFLGVGLVSGGFVFSCKGLFLAMYAGISAGAREVALQFMTVLSVTIIGSCYEACCLGSLVKAGGDTSFVFKNDSIFVFLVVLPSAFLARWLGAPLWVVFLCLKSDQLLKCIVAVIKVNRFRWIREIAKT
ncbi:MAG: MATE family efflux transporter [Clostridia bacterium]|nr:MATE family efflux transporter [Clostridia bacterium]MBQ8893210.1 MATE family efflux transporter [Clostridia bacterium]